MRPGRWWAGIVGAVTVVAVAGPVILNTARINLISLATLRPSSDAPYTSRPAPRESEHCRLAHVTGRAALAQGDVGTAIGWLEAATRCDDERWAWFDLGLAQHEAGQLEAVVQSWQAAGAYDYAALEARELAQEGERARAIEAWEFAAEIEPGNPEPYIAMSLLARDEELARSLQLLEEAIRVAPDSPDGYLAFGNYYWRREPDQAERYYLMALDRSPEDGTILLALGRNERDQGNIAQALDFFKQAAEATLDLPFRAQIYAEAGRLLLEDENPLSAVAFFEEAVRLARGRTGYRLGLGQAYAALGCLTAAAEQLNEVLARAPGSEAADQAAELLAGLVAPAGVEGDHCPSK